MSSAHDGRRWSLLRARALELLEQGVEVRSIAVRLCVSVSTVRVWRFRRHEHRARTIRRVAARRVG